MRNNISRIAGVFILAVVSGCAQVPPESVAVSRQLEKNLETLRTNNMLLLDAWYNLSVDYWTDKVGREGPDIILKKAQQAGITFDPAKDYADLVEQVLSEFRKNFLAELNTSYRGYRDTIEGDYQVTIGASQKLTNLLQSVVTVDAERAALIASISSDLGVNDEVMSVQSKLGELLKPSPK